MQPSGNPENLEAALKEGGLQIWGGVKLTATNTYGGEIRVVDGTLLISGTLVATNTPAVLKLIAPLS